MRTLPAATYDAIKRVADTFGGIGIARYYTPIEDGRKPCCAIGCLMEEDDAQYTNEDALRALFAHRGVEAASDRVVGAYLGLKAKDGCDWFDYDPRRMPFDLWAQALEIERGVE